VDAGQLIRAARRRAGLTLRELARRARTSHSTLAAYEAGRTVPSVATLDRIVRAAGFDADVSLSMRVGGGPEDREARARELVEVLELAEMFPARHAQELEYPKFGRVS
jgi:transcriptional regulator with XRE-family HTH domain